MIQILLAPNSFKECANSVQISGMILNSFREILREDVINTIDFIDKPISDGGDGFLEVCRKNFDLDILSYEITKPYNHEKFICEIGYSREKQTIYIESAKVLGLNIIPIEFRHPMLLSSIGMGELLEQISADVQSDKIYVRKIIVGIGGTGTNDFGIGLAAKFGLKLLNKNGEELSPVPKNFNEVGEIIWRQPDIPFEIEAVIDVDNSLTGEFGACKIFAPQKGASQSEIDHLENGFLNILKVLNYSKDPVKLSGAGGGLAAGLDLFFGANYKFSKDFITKDLGIKRDYSNLKLVITGEGSFDDQSDLAKGPKVIIDEFAGEDIPIYLLAGKINVKEIKIPDLKFIELSKYFGSTEESINNIEKGIQLACEEIISDLSLKQKV